MFACVCHACARTHTCKGSDGNHLHLLEARGSWPWGPESIEGLGIRSLEVILTYADTLLSYRARANVTISFGTRGRHEHTAPLVHCKPRPSPYRHPSFRVYLMLGMPAISYLGDTVSTQYQHSISNRINTVSTQYQHISEVRY